MLTFLRYYILRNDMMGYYLNDIQERLANRPESSGWEVGSSASLPFDFTSTTMLQEIEATLHCIMSIQEAVPLEDNHFIAQLFGPDVLGRLPTTGQDRIRRTTLGLIGKPHFQVHVTKQD